MNVRSSDWANIDMCFNETTVNRGKPVVKRTHPVINNAAISQDPLYSATIKTHPNTLNKQYSKITC